MDTFEDPIDWNMDDFQTAGYVSPSFFEHEFQSYVGMSFDHIDSRGEDLNSERLIHSNSTQVQDQAQATSSNVASKQRRRKAPTLRALDWEPHRELIEDLYVAQGLRLEDIAGILQRDYGFIATVRQYKSQLDKWKLGKHVKKNEMQIIVRKERYRNLVESERNPLRFRVRGNEVDPSKIQRWKRSNVPDEVPISPLSNPSTPSALSCSTISEVGSPVLNRPALASNDIPFERISNQPGSSSTVGRIQNEASRGSNNADMYSYNIFSDTFADRPLPTISTGDVHPMTFLTIPSHSAAPDSTEAGSFLEQSRIQNPLPVPEDAHTWTVLMSEMQARPHISRSEVIRMMSTPITTSADQPSIVQVNEEEISQSDFVDLRSVADRWREKVAELTLRYGTPHPQVAKALHELGGILRTNGQFVAAEKEFRNAIMQYSEIYGNHSIETLAAVTGLYDVLEKTGPFEDIIQRFHAHLELLGSTVGWDHPMTWRMAAILSRTLAAQSHPEHGLKIIERMSKFSARRSDIDVLRLNALNVAAELYIHLRRWDEARALLLHLYRITEKLPRIYSLAQERHIRFRFGMWFCGTNQWDVGELFMKLCLKDFISLFGEKHPRSLVAATMLAGVWKEQGEDSDATMLLTCVADLSRKTLGENHPDTVRWVETLNVWNEQFGLDEST